MNNFNLLKPTGYLMHQTDLTFNNCTFCPHCIYVFCIYLRTNSDLCHLQHKLVGFYNRDEKCLQRGTDWVFKYSSLRLVFRGLICFTVLQKVQFYLLGQVVDVEFRDLIKIVFIVKTRNLLPIMFFRTFEKVFFVSELFR